MSRRKEKLVLKKSNHLPGVSFIIAKSINTLEFGTPGDVLTRAKADRILIDKAHRIKSGELTVEFIS